MEADLQIQHGNTKEDNMTDKMYNGTRAMPIAELFNSMTKQTNFQRVKQFMTAMGQATPDRSVFPDENTQVLRFELIREELEELDVAMVEENLVGVADALTDLLYVVYGAGIAYGIDLDKTFAEVHRSNMSKLGPDGKPILRADGKVLKPDTYQPPQLEPLLNLPE